MDNRVLIDQQSSTAWTEVAIGSRIISTLLDLVGDPEPGSNFAWADSQYPFEKVSDRARAYLKAALEHLIFFADYAAPLKFHPDQAAMFTLRPTYTIARAALEAAVQSVWLVDVRDPRECIRRHLALIRWDLQEHRKSKIEPSAKAEVQKRENELINRVSAEFNPEEIRPPNGYLQVIREAVSAESIALSPDDAERLWRAASGVAHGKYWPTLDLQRVEVREEYEPGHFRTFQVPDTSGMTEMLRASFNVAQYGVIRYADYAGADIPALSAIAQERVFASLPLRNDITPEEIEHLRAANPYASQPET